MSLRARILALFLGLGVFPILLLGILGYARSTRAVRDLLEAQTSAIARQVATDLTDRAEQRLSELLLLAENVETQQLYRTRAGLGSLPMDSALTRADEYLTRAWSQFGRYYREIELLDTEGRRLFSLGSAPGPSTDVSAETSGAARTARVVVPVRDLETGEEAGRVVAEVNLREILPAGSLETTFGHSGYTFVVDRDRGEILHHPSRRFVNQPLSTLLGPEARAGDAALLATDSGSFTFRDGDSTRVASFVNVQALPWTVITTAMPEEFSSPFQGTRRSDLLVVLLLAAVVGGAFMVTLRRTTASLESLTEASERVGKGDLDPPLPPPGPDEVGRLAAAFSLMVAQVRGMLRRVEETRQMAIIGEMASNVSHQIRNPLTSIKLNLQALEEEAEAEKMSETSTRSLRICLREVGHLEDAVRKMRDLSRTHPPQRVETPLHGVISEAMELLQSQLAAAGVRIEARLAAAEDRVLADPEELKNVFVNLLVNAEEAMPEGGAVHLATENSMGADSPRMEETRLERTIRVRIRDEGPGVPEEVREQIFRPFVTTKPGGTGFGLAVVRMAVQEHQGRVYLESVGAPDPGDGPGGGGDRNETSGRGATFVVELPLAPASSSPAGEGPGAERGSSVPAVNQSEEAS